MSAFRSHLLHILDPNGLDVGEKLLEQVARFAEGGLCLEGLELSGDTRAEAGQFHALLLRISGGYASAAIDAQPSAKKAVSA